jgi:hypothetical protein
VLNDRGSIPEKISDFLFFISTTITPNQWVPEVKLSGLEADYSSMPSVDVKNGVLPLLSHTSSWSGA